MQVENGISAASVCGSAYGSHLEYAPLQWQKHLGTPHTDTHSRYISEELSGHQAWQDLQYPQPIQKRRFVLHLPVAANLALFTFPPPNLHHRDCLV